MFIQKRSKIIGVTFISVLLFSILTHQWVVPAFSNRIDVTSNICAECVAIRLLRAPYRPNPIREQTKGAPPVIIGDGIRREFVGETLEELVLIVNRYFPDKCDYCAYLMAKIASFPIDSPQWQIAWDAFHAR